MLGIIAAVLVILWLLGFFAFHVTTAAIHIILVIALVIFGPKKIPEIANSLGRSINEFKKGAKEIETSVRREIESADAKSNADDPASRQS